MCFIHSLSILYKMKLPFVVVLNKTDTVDHSFAVDWMNDFEIFQEALEQVRQMTIIYNCTIVRVISINSIERFS